ncbi:hypothetical protein AB2D02_32580, partial [Pseudomonas aeruginosa]
RWISLAKASDVIGKRHVFPLRPAAQSEPCRVPYGSVAKDRVVGNQTKSMGHIGMSPDRPTSDLLSEQDKLAVK